MYVLAVVLVLFVLPGMLLSRLRGKDQAAATPVAVWLFAGAGGVCGLSFLVAGLAGSAGVSAPLVAGMSLSITAAAMLLLRRKVGNFAFVKELAVGSLRDRVDLPLMLFLLLVGCLFLLSYDSSLSGQRSCLARAGVLPFFNCLLTSRPRGFAGVFTAPFSALFGLPAPRLVHLFSGLMAAWFGWHLGRELFSSRTMAFVTAALLVLNPFVLSIAVVDENLICLGLGTALLWAALKERPDYLLVGLFLALVLGTRYSELLAAPGLFSRPFVPALARSPYHGYPTLLALPLTLIKTWGAVLPAFAPLGLVRAWRASRRRLLVCAIWFGVPCAVLLAMAAWGRPTRMAVFLCFCQPLVLAIVAGLAEAFAPAGRARRGFFAAVVALTLVALFFFQYGVGKFEAPLDRRSYEHRVEDVIDDHTVIPPMLIGVEGDYARLEREELAAFSPLPAWPAARWLFRLSSLRHRLATLVADLSSPRLWDDSLPERGEDSPSEELVTLVLDLSKAPVRNPHFLAFGGGATTFAPDFSDGIWISPHFPVDWTDGLPCHVVLVPQGSGAYTLYVSYGQYDFGHLDELPEATRVAPQLRSMLIFRLPAGSLLRVVDTTSIEPNRFHVWTVSVDPEPTMRGPVPVSY